MGSSIFSSSSFGLSSRILYIFFLSCVNFPSNFICTWISCKAKWSDIDIFSSILWIVVPWNSTLSRFYVSDSFPFFANFLPTGPTNVFSRINDGALYIREFLHRRKWFPAARRHVSRFDEHTRILAPWRNAQPITSAEILSDSRSASTFVTGHGRFTSESRVAFLFLASNRHLEITTDSILRIMIVLMYAILPIIRFAIDSIPIEGEILVIDEILRMEVEFSKG